jgi:hypothetical protein
MQIDIQRTMPLEKKAKKTALKLTLLLLLTIGLSACNPRVNASETEIVQSPLLTKKNVHQIKDFKTFNGKTIEEVN